MRRAFAAALLAPLLGGAAAYPSPDEVLAKAPASAWQALDPGSTLYMDLPAGRVVILLAPGFAPKTVANIKQLVAARYFDNSAIVRSRSWFPAQHHSQPRPLSVQLFHGRGLSTAGSIRRIREPSRAASIAEQLHPIGQHMRRPGSQRGRQRIVHNRQSRLPCLTRLAGLLLGLIALPRRCIGDAGKALLRQLGNGNTIAFIDSPAKPSLHIGGLKGKLIGSPLRHRKPQLHRRPATRSGKVRHKPRQLQ